MELDKVVDSAALDAGMTSVADAIRSKAGTTEPLVWPDGFKAAVEGIQTGGGGGGKSASGTYTPASDAGFMIVELDFIPNIIEFILDDYDNKALDGVSKTLAGAYCNGIAFSSRTNASGTTVGGAALSNGIDTLIVENDNSYPNPYIPRPRAAGGFFFYSNYIFPAGYTYSWRCSE